MVVGHQASPGGHQASPRGLNRSGLPRLHRARGQGQGKWKEVVELFKPKKPIQKQIEQYEQTAEAYETDAEACEDEARQNRAEAILLRECAREYRAAAKKLKVP